MIQEKKLPLFWLVGALVCSVLVLLLVAFGVSAVMVGNYLVGSKEQADRNDELVQMVEDAKNPTQTETLPGESAPGSPEQRVTDG